MFLQGVQGAEIKGNTVSGFGITTTETAGIYLGADGAFPTPQGGNLIDSNTISGGTQAFSYGIYIFTPSPANRVTNNTVRACSHHGILTLSDYTIITGNNTSENSFDGIQADSEGNHIARNTSSGNVNTGIAVYDSGSLVEENTCRSNGNGGNWHRSP